MIFVLLDNPNPSTGTSVNDDLQSVMLLKSKIEGLRAIVITDVKDRTLRE